ncbi:MAG TPA: radical SAM protein [Terriglobia bacterium]|nr:radical SAM protein [Terriglobia bacterium]
MQIRAKRLLEPLKLAAQQRSHRLTTLPILIVYLNDICNSRCLTCAIWQNNERLRIPGERQMSDRILAELYGEIERWRPSQVLLSGGEPAMHPRLPDVVRRLEALGSRIALITNGLLLTSFSHEELRPVSEVYISFDAPTPELYKTIRGVDGFDRMAGAIGFLKSMAAPPRIVARSTLQRDNVGEIPELVGTAQRLGFDGISFLGVDVSSSAFARGFPDHAVDPNRIQPQIADLEAMTRGIEELELAKTLSSFIEGGAQRLRRILQYFNALLGRGDFPPMQCNAPWISAVIETTGKMRGCFFHPVIGDLRTINGPKAVEFRKALRVESNPTCRRCVCNKLLRPLDVWRL